MKKTFIYSLLLVFISCNQPQKGKVETFDNEHTSEQVTKTSRSVSIYDSVTETKKNYILTLPTEDGDCVLNSYCFTKTKPQTDICVRLHVEQAGNHLKDTLKC